MLIEQKFLIGSIFVLSIVVYIQRKEPMHHYLGKVLRYRQDHL